MPSSATLPSPPDTLLGSTVPRIYTPPAVRGRRGPCGCGCALTPSTSLGFSAVQFAEEVLGFELIPWQRWLFIHALELRADGRFRFRTVLILIARQNGKTTWLEVKNLWKMFILRVPLVIGTSVDLDRAEESWDKAVEIVESIPELWAEVPREGGIVRVNGKKALKLTHGSRWKVSTASRRGARGYSGDDVNLDELREHQTWDAWAAVSKTTMARRKAQIWALSNAGDDKSVVLNDLRDKCIAALAEPDSSLGLFEWSAPQDCPIDDPQMMRLANPSMGYPQGISHEALLAALETDPEPIFRTECLCQRVPTLVKPPQWDVIGRAEWDAAADVADTIVKPVAFGLEVDWQREWSAFAVAWRRPDGLRQVELTQSDDGVDLRRGTRWCLGRAKELLKAWPGSVLVFDPGGPAGSLVKDFEDDKVPFTPMNTADAAKAFGDIFDGIAGADPAKRDVRHGNQPALNTSVEGAVERTLVSARAWDRKNSRDFAPIGAGTAALFGLRNLTIPRSKIY